MRKTVLITGANQGLGRAFSKAFSEHGYYVYAGSYLQDAELFGPGERVYGDISDEAAVRQMFSGIGRLDVLINNARFDPSKREEGISDGEWWDKNLDVSLKGTYLCTLEALKIMKRQQSGAILNVSSIRGIIPNEPLRIAYGAAKAGQISLTRSFAKEAGAYNVRVNALLPGAVATENLMSRITPERHEEVCREIALHRIGTMEEMAHAALFLAENTYVTGACLHCSGGLLLDA